MTTRHHLIGSITTFTLTAGLFPAAAMAQQYEAPATYYSSVDTSSAATLRTTLHNIIDNHTVVSYDNARYALQVIDEDPTRPENMTLFYDNTPLNLANINPGGTNSGANIKGWDQGGSWQREHAWPQSRQIIGTGSTSSGPDYSDLHLLHPAGSSNQSRGNSNYGGTGGTAPGSSGGYYYPGSAHRGEAARLSFYADVRYDGSDSNTVDLRLVNGNPSANSGQMGDLATLLRWHYADPVAATEVRRNDLIYRPDNWTSSSRYNDIGSRTFTQGNRNPFVDRPEYVHAIFVDQANDTRLRVGTANADGTSAADVNLGRVLRNAAVPAAQNVTLTKEGLDGTYYSVTASGAATSSVTGRYNAFAMDTTGSRGIAVGLSTSTATAGLKSGAVTIDNLDVTAQGGLGRGANDGNDVVNVSLKVLDVSNSSFIAGSDKNSLVLDFGTITQGSSASPLAFSLTNLASTLGTDLTARLDLDQIVPSGNSGVLTTNLARFSNLNAGAVSSYLAFLNSSAVGDFSATYLLRFSDENLPGTVSTSTLTLQLTGDVVAVPEPAMITALLAVPAVLLRRSYHRRRRPI